MDTKKNINISHSLKVNTDSQAVDEFLERGTVKIYTKEELRKKMLSGKQLRAYIGYDVTGPNLHLGNGSTMMKLRDWQQLGHQVTLVIGDYTSRVGDHSDKLEKRKRLTIKEIEENKHKFTKQFGKLVDLSTAEVRFNSQWLASLSFNDVINLASLFSVQQMIERKNFALRLEKQKTIGLEEILYPLMQGYDSVALKVDLEIGGTDQTFNMLAGRKIMQAFQMKPQNVLTMPLIPGTDGRKMSKSWNNYIPMLASPNNLYGGIMSCCDEIIAKYFELLTRIPRKELQDIEQTLKTGKANPMQLKKKLANKVTAIYFDKKKAEEAEEYFEQTVQKKKIPDEMPEMAYTQKPNTIEFIKFLVEKGLISSNAEAKRLLKQGALTINEKKITTLDQKLVFQKQNIVKIGKRKFVKIIRNN